MAVNPSEFQRFVQLSDKSFIVCKKLHNEIQKISVFRDILLTALQQSPKSMKKCSIYQLHYFQDLLKQIKLLRVKSKSQQNNRLISDDYFLKLFPKQLKKSGKFSAILTIFDKKLKLYGKT